jgi:hypothetical protein
MPPEGYYERRRAEQDRIINDYPRVHEEEGQGSQEGESRIRSQNPSRDRVRVQLKLKKCVIGFFPTWECCTLAS